MKGTQAPARPRFDEILSLETADHVFQIEVIQLTRGSHLDMK